MKKFHLLVAITLLIQTIAAQQQKETKVNTGLQEKGEKKAVDEHNIIIEPYYGFPYWWGYIAKAAYRNNTVYDNVSVKNQNHLGGKIEYMVSPRIGIGADFTYANVSISYRNYTTSNSKGFIDYKASISKLRILGRMNFHLGSSMDFDPYATIGFGYKQTLINDNDPGSPLKNETITLVPISGRVGVGCRYFFSEMFGIHMEMGLG